MVPKKVKYTMEDMAMARTKEEQNFYNKLLVTQAINYQKLGYTDIKVNRSNYIHGHPSKVGGFTPDLSAVLEDAITLCEVVTMIR
jgi:hypothetical protein